MACKNEDSDSVMAFDALYTTNQIQKMKVLLPYIEPSMQKHLAIYIKYMELQYTLNYTKEHPFHICSQRVQPPDLGKLCRELSLYSSPEEIRQLNQFQNMIQTFKTVQEMSQTFSYMQEIFPNMGDFADMADGFTAQNTSGSPEAGNSPSGFQSTMMDMLMNMLTPEQKEMYQMFQKEGENHEQ